MTELLARCKEKLTGGPQAGISDSPPLARVKGVGRQQNHLQDAGNPGMNQRFTICRIIFIMEDSELSILLLEKDLTHK